MKRTIQFVRPCVLLAMLFLLPGQAMAGVISVTGNDNGLGSIQANASALDEFEIIVDKSYDQLGSMSVEIEVDEAGLYFFAESITNNTGTPWTDFHWQFAGETDATFFLGFEINPLPLPFTNIAYLSSTAGFVDEGVLANGATFNPVVLLQVDSTSGGVFTLTQFPSTAVVPEPSTFALLGIGGIALVAYGWRRKRQQAA